MRAKWRLAKLRSSQSAREQLSFFETTSVRCNCRETKHVSKMYRTSICYCHQLLLRADQPPLTPFRWILADAGIGKIGNPTLSFDHRVPRMRTDGDIAAQKGRAVKRIKKRAHAMQRDGEIRAFVEENSAINDIFVLGDCTAFFALISEGIAKFSLPK
jgi:hypothetical protein